MLKCFFAYLSVKALGYYILHLGVSTLAKKIEAVINIAFLETL
jgi:hypothetical protein